MRYFHLGFFQSVWYWHNRRNFGISLYVTPDNPFYAYVRTPNAIGMFIGKEQFRAEFNKEQRIWQYMR